MANELAQFYSQGIAAGYNLYAFIRNLTGQIWDAGQQVFEDYGTGSRTAEDYGIDLTNKKGGLYLGDFDANIADGIYYVQVLQRLGATKSDTNDPVIGGGRRRWIDGVLYEDDTLWLNSSVSIATATHTYTVLDSNGNGIADVLVEAKAATDGPVIQSARTDANGIATFYLPAGDYYFYATKSGYTFDSNPDLETVS